MQTTRLSRLPTIGNDSQPPQYAVSHRKYAPNRRASIGSITAATATFLPCGEAGLLTIPLFTTPSPRPRSVDSRKSKHRLWRAEYTWKRDTFETCKLFLPRYPCPQQRHRKGANLPASTSQPSRESYSTRQDGLLYSASHGT